MNKLFVFYLMVLIPLAIIFTLFILDYNNAAVISLMLYALVYRPITDYNKLKASGLKEELPLWKMILIPYSIQYFKELYLK